MSLLEDGTYSSTPQSNSNSSNSSSGTTPPSKMLQQLTQVVSDESCVKCAFDFDCDEEEFYVIDDEDDDEDDFCITNDGAYWKTPMNPICTTFYNEEEEIDFTMDNYDHETLTTRFSRQTSATLESILGGSSSLLSPSANFIIEDLHLLEQTHKNTTNHHHHHQQQQQDAGKKTRPTLAKVEGSPSGSPLIQHCSSPSHPGVHVVRQPVVTSPHAPSPSHQNLNSPTFSTSPNHHTTTSNDAGAPTSAKSPRRWSNLSPTFFGSKKSRSSPSPRNSTLPPIVEDTTTVQASDANKKYSFERRFSNLSPTFFGSRSPLPTFLESIAEQDDTTSKKSKNTHPSTSTASLTSSSDVLLHHYEEDYHPVPHRNNRGVELTLSGSVMELDLTLSESIAEEDKSEIIRLDSIASSPSSLFFSVTEDDLVIMEKMSKRKRWRRKFRSKVAAWKRIAMFHLFPHRRTYTRFEI